MLAGLEEVSKEERGYVIFVGTIGSKVNPLTLSSMNIYDNPSQNEAS